MKSPTSLPPESLQKGLLQVLWTARPWIRNLVLLLAALVFGIYAIVPADVRSDLLRALFKIGQHSAMPDSSQLGSDNSMNSLVWTLKNGHQVRVLGSVVKNESNVDDAIVRHEVEYDAWQYNRCYDNAFGQLNTAMPRGTVVISFDILDQLPQQARVDRSDFPDSVFARCLVGTLIGQTINQAGRNGIGHVTYAFKFVPN